MITLEINGIEYTGFTSAESFRSVESVSGVFSFEATSTENITFPISIGDKCRVLIDGQVVNNGFVEQVSPSYGVDEHALFISGRDKTMDMIDSSMVNKSTFQGTVSLQNIIKQALAAGGISDVSVTNNVIGLSPFKSTDIQSSTVGESIFEFCEKYARKRQVLLTGDGNGNVVITRSGISSSTTGLFNIVGGTKNNIKSARATYTHTDVFNRYVIKSQSSISGLLSGGTISPSDVVNQQGEATDASARSSRQLELVPPASMPTEDAKNYALWQRNLRRAKAFSASVVIHGHSQGDGTLWQHNQLVDLQDDFLGRRGTFLIKSVANIVDNDNGETTRLDLVEPDVYTLDAQVSDFENDQKTDVGILG